MDSVEQRQYQQGILQRLDDITVLLVELNKNLAQLLDESEEEQEENEDEEETDQGAITPPSGD